MTGKGDLPHTEGRICLIDTPGLTETPLITMKSQQLPNHTSPEKHSPPCAQIAKSREKAWNEQRTT